MFDTVEVMCAEDRAVEIMRGRQNDIPVFAYKYALQLTKKPFSGGGQETLFAALCHYAQLIEGLSCKDIRCSADEAAINFFDKIKN